MNESFDWDKKVEFNGFSHWTGYENVIIPTTLTYRAFFVAVGTLMLTYTDISLIQYGFNHTIYGDTSPIFVVRDFDFNTILLKLSKQGVIDLSEAQRALLTEKGKSFLCDNETVDIAYFERLRQEAKRIIEESRSSNVVPAAQQRNGN